MPPIKVAFTEIGPLGATYAAAVGGLLSAIWRAPFTVGFALMCGLLMDGFCYAMNVKGSEGSVKMGRLVVAVTVSTVTFGLSGYYVTVFVFGILPRNPFLEFIILTAGTLNGLIAAYLTVIIWSRIARYLTWGGSSWAGVKSRELDGL